jgi:hypothetical protein
MQEPSLNRGQHPYSKSQIAGAIFLSILLLPASPLFATQAAQTGAAPTAQELAPRDITGYWVSIVSEDWHVRMVTPRKGNYESLPINDEGKRVADAWDPAGDTASGTACKSYGAAAIMRVPGRVHITWEDSATLRLETDAGMQTRRFFFGRQATRGWRTNARGEVEWFESGRDAPPPAGQQGLQGYSSAVWDLASDPAVVRSMPFFAGGLGTGADGAGVVTPGRFGTLLVRTAGMQAGYLRKNGVPYSGDALLTEYYDFRTEDDGTEWFTVTTIVEDPQYLSAPFVTSTDFRKEPDGSKWRPTPCTAY